MMSSNSSFPTRVDEIILPHQYTQESSRHTGPSSLYKTIAALRRSTLSIPNRLNSVLQDAEYVKALQQYLSESVPLSREAWPLVPNERSGSWPLDPELKQKSQGPYTVDPSFPGSNCCVSAYFKSTDGHINQWAFSTRRLNLPVLELLGSAGGAILVDTTRRGKAFPDALRRTVPIWCAVWNQLLFPDASDHDITRFQGFRLDVSEIAQIETRLPQFLKDLKRLDLDLSDIRQKVSRPIRCVWTSQPPTDQDWKSALLSVKQEILHEQCQSTYVNTTPVCNVLVCASASRQVVGAEMSEDGYIQGAGDDSEGWSHGLNAALFWQHQYNLIKKCESDEAELQEYIATIISQSQTSPDLGRLILVKPTHNLFLGWKPPSSEDPFLLIDCSSAAGTHTELVDSQRLLQLNCKEGKAGSKQLREKLAIIHDHVLRLLQKSHTHQIYVRCATGRDLSVGVALMLLCSFYSESGKSSTLSSHLVNIVAGAIRLQQQSDIGKELVKQRLAWISTVKPDANPSRATLQAVNSYLMQRSV